ncbi:MAG: hypothetical protein PHW83_08250, partial [Bacteroidales bacterium]|nr:hypothetical protein [Bacteroidales bacterium]
MKTKYTILTLIQILLFAGFTFAQTSLPVAEQQMQKFDYVKAIDMYLNHFIINKPNDTDIRNMSYCYIKINDTKNAEIWLSKVIQSGSATSEDIIIYADLLKSEGRYIDAIVYYQKLKEEDPSKSKFADENIKICEEVLVWLESEPDFVVKNEEKLNSVNSDFGIVNFGESFIFTSDRIPPVSGSSQNMVYGWTGNPYLKLYEVNMNKSDSIRDISIMSELNNDYHNGPGYFDVKTNTFYFTRTKLVKQNSKTQNPDPTAWFKEKTDIYTNRLEIYKSEIVDGKWQKIIEFEHNNAEAYSIGHPVLSPDGNILYFVSDMSGGFGETDIYYSEKLLSGKWSNPQNIGGELNTAGKELFPSFDADGKLYFASDGHIGMGGLDIFKSTGSKTSWTSPENLKYPLNSPKDDFAIIFTEPDNMGYLASNRYGGIGSDDIYSFVYSPPPPPIPTELILAVTTFETLDDGTIQPLENVDLHYHKDGDGSKVSLIPIYPGMYQAVIDCDSDYIVNGEISGYFTQTTTIKTKCETMNDTVFVQLMFERIVINKPIVIENI